MILHFTDVNGERLNINFDKHIWNDLRYNTFFCVTVSQVDMDRIKDEMDFNMFSYSLEDPTITPEEEITTDYGEEAEPF